MISRRITSGDVRNTYIADDDGVLVITQDLVRNLWHITGLEYWHAHELGPHAPPAVLAVWREERPMTDRADGATLQAVAVAVPMMLGTDATPAQAAEAALLDVAASCRKRAAEAEISQAQARESQRVTA